MAYKNVMNICSCWYIAYLAAIYSHYFTILLYLSQNAWIAFNQSMWKVNYWTCREKDNGES